MLLDTYSMVEWKVISAIPPETPHRAAMEEVKRRLDEVAPGYSMYGESWESGIEEYFRARHRSEDTPLEGMFMVMIAKPVMRAASILGILSIDRVTAATLILQGHCYVKTECGKINPQLWWNSARKTGLLTVIGQELGRKVVFFDEFAKEPVFDR